MSNFIKIGENYYNKHHIVSIGQFKNIEDKKCIWLKFTSKNSNVQICDPHISKELEYLFKDVKFGKVYKDI